MIRPTAGASLCACTGQSGIVDTRRPPQAEQTSRPLASMAGKGRSGGNPMASNRSVDERTQNLVRQATRTPVTP